MQNWAMKESLKVSSSFGSFLTASLTLYSTFCVRCAPHHLPPAEARLSSSHVPGVSLTNLKIKLRCQGSLVKVWVIWITHHQLSSPKDYFIFCSAPQPHSLCIFCLPQMPKSPLESRCLHWFILKTAPPYTRKKETMRAEVRVKGTYDQSIKNCIIKHPHAWHFLTFHPDLHSMQLPHI